MLDVFLITAGVALLSLLVFTVRSLCRSRSRRRSRDDGEVFAGFDDHSSCDDGGHGESSGGHADGE